jgi:hypothetical protein
LELIMPGTGKKKISGERRISTRAGPCFLVAAVGSDRTGARQLLSARIRAAIGRGASAVGELSMTEEDDDEAITP